MLEPIADGFRNYLRGKHTVPAEALLVDRAQLLTLSAEAPLGGARAIRGSIAMRESLPQASAHRLPTEAPRTSRGSRVGNLTFHELELTRCRSLHSYNMGGTDGGPHR